MKGWGKSWGKTAPEIEKTTQETIQEIEETTQEMILRLIKTNPAITRKGLAGKIGLTPDGVKYHLDYAPFDGKGGIGKMVQLFRGEMEPIIDEMNESLAAWLWI